MISLRATVVIASALAVLQSANGFAFRHQRRPRSFLIGKMSKDDGAPSSNKDGDVLDAAIAAMFGGDSGNQEGPETTQIRIRELVDEHSVLLFMKGNRAFPQCGFSDTATKILELYDIDFHTVDVLEDEANRQGIKIYSQWPTIPQLYVAGEFIGGSDIMLEMHEKGELKELIGEAASS